MVDYLTDIPLPGRILAPPNAPAAKQCDARTAARLSSPARRIDSSPARSAQLHANRRRRLASAVQRKSVHASVLVLFGPSGTGKTHLAHGLVRHWQDATRRRERGVHSPPPISATASTTPSSAKPSSSSAASSAAANCWRSTTCSICRPTTTLARTALHARRLRRTRRPPSSSRPPNRSPRCQTCRPTSAAASLAAWRSNLLRRATPPACESSVTLRTALRPAALRRSRRPTGRRPRQARQTACFGAVFELCSGANRRADE